MQRVPTAPQNPNTPKVLVVLGPTASGKSTLAVDLAQAFSGEVISADSRQVYRGMDIGSGKITSEEMQGVPHHLLSIADPNEQFSVPQFQTLGRQAIASISERGHLPIICGGTAFYIRALVENLSIPEVPPNPTLRDELASLSTPELSNRLLELDPVRHANIDQHNPVRLIRAIEIAKALGSVPSLTSTLAYPTLFLGIKKEASALRQAIEERLTKRLASGMLDEARHLHETGLSYERMESFGLEYRAMAEYLQGKISHDTMSTQIITESIQYTKRQMTWWKHDPRIHWVSGEDIVTPAKAIIRAFLY